MIHPKQKSIESPFFLLLNLRGTNPNRTDFLHRTLLYIYYPFAADDTPFGLEDGWLLNELTLCIFDGGYWWSTSLSLTWHNGLFVPDCSLDLP